MFALFIDTSAQSKIFAILNENRVIDSYCYPAVSNTINEPVFAWLQECNKKYGFVLSDLDYVAVGYGPGPSFTGARIGVAIASSLAYACAVPIVGLCSLELYKPATSSNIFYHISDARGGKLYYVQGEITLDTYQFTAPKMMDIYCWQDTFANKKIQIISIQYEFFRDMNLENVIPTVINWEYIMKKIFQTNTYSDPLLFTIPYCKNPI